MPTQATIRARVRLRLEEQAAAVWGDGEINEAVAETVEEYNHRFPMERTAELAVGEGDREVAAPEGAVGVVRVLLADGRVVPRRLGPVGDTAGERLAWELFAGVVRFTRPLAAGTVTLWYLGPGAIDELPEADAGLLVLGAVWRALQQRGVQSFKRGALGGVSFDLIARAARVEYMAALDARGRRLKVALRAEE